MWNINGHQLNLGFITGTSTGVSIWDRDEYSYWEYKTSELYRYQRPLGIGFVERDLQYNIEYIDQFGDVEYMDSVSDPSKDVKLFDFAMSKFSSPRAAMISLREKEDTIYSYLFVCYVWLKHYKSELEKDVGYYGFGDSNFLWNGIIHTAYEDGKLKATYEEYYNGWESESNRELKQYTGYITLEDVKTMIRMEARDATKYLLNLLGCKSN